MGRKIIISEEQYKKMVDETVNIEADPAKTGGDIKRAYDIAQKEAQRSGITDLKKVKIQFPAEGTNENRVITKSQLQKNRLKVLKENSQIYSVKDFMSKMKNKNR